MKALGLPGDFYGRFTVNLGVYASGLVIDEGDARDGWVNEYNCQLRKRIGDLLTDRDVWWSLDSPDAAGEIVETALTLAGLPWLDRFPTTSSIVDEFVSEGWEPLGMAPRGPLEVAWLLKDTDRGGAEKLIRDYLGGEFRHPGHRGWVEAHLRRAGFSHLLESG